MVPASYVIKCFESYLEIKNPCRRCTEVTSTCVGTGDSELFLWKNKEIGNHGEVQVLPFQVALLSE